MKHYWKISNKKMTWFGYTTNDKKIFKKMILKGYKIIKWNKKKNKVYDHIYKGEMNVM